MVQRRAARFVCNNYHNTSSVTDMVNTLQWPPLAERRLKSRLVIFYKIVHCLIAVPADHILTPTDSRTRSTHSLSYKHLQTTKDTYKWSFFPPYCNLLEFSPIISSSVKISRHIQRTAVPSCSPVPPLLNIKHVFKFLITLYIKCTQIFVVLLWSRMRTVRNLRYPEGVLYIRRRRRIHVFLRIWPFVGSYKCT